MKFVDQTGIRFGMLITLRHLGGQSYEFLCDCGKSHVASIGNVKYGRTKSCGCFGKRVKVPEHHGMRGTPEYQAWQSMITRATNPKFVGAKRYSERGITVCEKWRHSFSEFYAEVGLRPSPEYSLDRINNDKGYEPGNVRWATKREQALNRSSNALLTVGNATKPVSQWASEKGINRTTLDARIARGCSGESLFAPVRQQGRRAC